MSVFQPFNPAYGSTQNVTAAAASASISLTRSTKQVRIENTGATNPAYIRIGQGTQTATAADLVVSPGKAVVVTKMTDDNVLAHISAAGTTLSIMEGEGW